MKKKARIISLLLCVVLCVAVFSGCSPKAATTDNTQASDEYKLPEVLRIGMECGFPPHNWTQLEASDYTVKMPDNTYVDGYDVQIAKKIAAELGCEIEIVKVDWDGLPASLTSKKIDLIIAGMTDTEERRETLDFTDIYWSSDLVIVVKADGPYANATSLADFDGAKITAQMETLHYDMVDKIPNVNKLAAMADFPTMLMALSSDKIDGYVAERPAAISAGVTNPNIKFIAFEGNDGFGEEMPVSIGLRKGETELCEKINAILAKITIAERQQLMEDAVERQPLSD